MALFLGFHDLNGAVTEDVVNKSWNAYKEACLALGCEPKIAHYNTEQGKAFYLTEADSAEDVHKAHEQAQVPVQQVLEVKELK